MGRGQGPGKGGQARSPVTTRPADVGQAEVAALEAVGQLRVVEAEEVEDRGLEVVDVDAVLDGRKPNSSVAPRIRPGFDAAAGHPHREGVDVVVAADVLADLAHRRAAELAPPDDQRLVEQAARFRSVISAAHGRSMSRQTRSRSPARSWPGPPWWSQSVW